MQFTYNIISTHSVVTLEFSSASYQFTEGKTLNLVVRKSGPLDSAITFNVLSDGLSIDETRTFEAGVDAPAAITISIITLNDVIALEPDKVNTVTLTPVTPNPQIELGISQATVTEIDDDSEFYFYFVYEKDYAETGFLTTHYSALHKHLSDHACINQPLGTKVEFPERREIVNTFTIIPIHFKCLIMPITLDWKVQSKDQLENRYTMLCLSR